MPTTFLSTSGPCDCSAECPTFVNTVKITPPPTGYDCPYILEMSMVFPSSDPDVPGCNQVVCRTIHCPQSLQDLQAQLNTLFPLSPATEE